MQITVDLQDMFSYSPIPAMISGVLACVFLILFLRSQKKQEKKKQIPKVKKVRLRSLSETKAAYMRGLADLERKYKEQVIEERVAFQELSQLIRKFIYEAGGINLLNDTLEEIKRMNMPKLSGVTEVIESCYVPEFAAENDGNFNESINRARKVIEQWN